MKIAVLTGGTDGMGRGAAPLIAALGFHLVIQGRNAARGQAVVDEITAKGGSAEFMAADFASLADTRRFAAALRAKFPRIDLMINNAGIGTGPQGAPREESRDGIEMILAVNYLAGFLLNRLLIDRFAGRVVNVASDGQAAIRFDDLMLTRNYTGEEAYCRSKVALIMASLDLACELKPRGVTVNTMHPNSFMNTAMVALTQHGVVESLEEGVARLVALATDPKYDGQTGRYLNRGIDMPAHAQCYDLAARARLRAVSMQLAGLEGPMNRAAYTTDHRKMELGPAPMPVPEDNEVLIKMKFCGVCGSDVHFYEHGEAEFPDVYPFILGHEGAGEVVAVGKDVTTHKVGDRVCLEPGITCGTCEWCKSGRYNLCPEVVFKSAPREHGILRDYVAHPADLSFHIPDHMSYEEGALIEPLAVAMTAVREAGARIGQSAAILGSGCIGLVTVMALRAVGITNITVVDLFDIRLDKAREVGARNVVNARNQDPIAAVKALHGGIGPDLVFETAGSTVAAAQTIAMAKRGGTIMIVGNVVGQTPIDFQLMTNKELTIKSNFRYSNIYPTTIEAVASGRIDVKSIISRRYALQDAPRAFEDCIEEKSTMVKAIIQFEQP